MVNCGFKWMNERNGGRPCRLAEEGGLPFFVQAADVRRSDKSAKVKSGEGDGGGGVKEGGMPTA